ncbi:MAG: UDP-N-acetylmuramate--L-alanine ligase, partial [Luteibaculum sp.]
MSDSRTYKNLFFLGIGGIGMSALAQYFHRKGYQISGYDKVDTEVTQLLQEQGISVIYSGDNFSLPGHWKIAETAVVYTPAIPSSFSLYKQLLGLGLNFHKRSEVLGWISQEIPTIAIAGTHGKTTTTAIVSHALKSSGKKILAFIGGIASNYRSNIIMDENPEFLVAEADEFDRSFLRLHPKMAVVTSVDPDHLDIYGEASELSKAFTAFTEQVEGPIFAHASTKSLLIKKGILFYDSSERGIEEINYSNGKAHIHYRIENESIKISWSVPGKHNALNALAAICICKALEIPSQKIISAMETFAGVKRRFETILDQANKVLIDDYAHHPTEIA